MQVAPYRDPYDDQRSSTGYSDGSAPHHHSHEHRGSAADYYDDPARPRSRGEGHRSSVSGEKGLGHSSGASHHSGAKDIGASLLGAAVGGFAGHEIGHGKVSALIGAVAGGVAGHKLEGKYERRQEERERKRRESEVVERRYAEGPYAGYREGRRRRRRISEDDSSGSETDSSYERRHHGH